MLPFAFLPLESINYPLPISTGFILFYIFICVMGKSLDIIIYELIHLQFNKRLTRTYLHDAQLMSFWSEYESGSFCCKRSGSFLMDSSGF